MSKPNTTKSTASTSGLRVRSKVRAGAGIDINHGLRIRTKVRAGGSRVNHGLRISSIR